MKPAAEGEIGNLAGSFARLDGWMEEERRIAKTRQTGGTREALTLGLEWTDGPFAGALDERRVLHLCPYTRDTPRQQTTE